MIDALERLRTVVFSAGRWMSAELSGPDRTAAGLLLGCLILAALALARATAERFGEAGRHRRLSYHSEPAMAEVLADPIIQTLMTRDGVARETLDGLVEAATRRQATRFSAIRRSR